MYMICSVNDCLTEVKTKNLCNRHYLRLWNHGDLLADYRLTHGASYTRLYRIWHCMNARCNKPNNQAYKDYGGRGITVCDEWKDDVNAFSEWAYTVGYTDELTIDRIDNNKGYSPDNCRWATMSEQCNNRRNNHILEFRNKKQTMAQWAIELGWTRETIENRIRRGWSIEKSLTQKPRRSPIKVLT